MNMTVATRLASLWTHAMFAVLAAPDKSGTFVVDLSRASSTDLVGGVQAVGGPYSYLAGRALATRAPLFGYLNHRLVGHVFGGLGRSCQHHVWAVPGWGGYYLRLGCLSMLTKMKCMLCPTSCNSSARGTRKCHGGGKC